MKIKISCEDKYESQKLASLIFIKDSQETYITRILNIVENEVVVELKDKLPFNLKKMRYGLQFSKLTAEQNSKLLFFIRNHTS